MIKIKHNLLKVVGFISAFITLPFLYFKLKKNATRVFCFFPSWELGGAERVHLHILSCIEESRPTCFITFKINNDGFKKEFHNLSYIIKLGFWGGHLRRFSIPIIAKHINQQEHPVVFGSNSRYFHDLIPYLRPDIKVIDLDHSFNKASNNIKESIQYYSKKVIHRINTRVVLGEIGKKENLNFYHNFGIKLPESKFLVIPNAVDVPNEILNFSEKKNQIMFVGRAAWLKRPHIFMNIAKKLKTDLPHKFVCIGNFTEDYKQLYPEVEFTGEIYDKEALTQYYKESKYIILCSITEGLPMVILEAMAYGVIPICVEVGELSSLINDSNGIIIPNSDDDHYVERELSNHIKRLERKPLDDLNQMSSNAHKICYEHYSKTIFCNRYRNLILGDLL